MMQDVLDWIESINGQYTWESDLKIVALNGSSLQDEDLAMIAKLDGLMILDLTDTPVGDAGLAHLHGLSSLEDICVAGTKATDHGLASLKQAIPGIEVATRHVGEDDNPFL